MESLPQIFLVIYMIIFSITLVASIVYWVKQRFSALAAIAMILSLLIPLVSFVYTAQRKTGNGYEFMLEKVFDLNGLAITLMIGYVYIIGWLIFVITELLTRLYHVPFINEKLKPMFQKMEEHWIKKGIPPLKRFFSLIREKLPKKRKKADETLEEEHKQSSQ